MNALPKPPLDESLEPDCIPDTPAIERRRFLETLAAALQRARCGGYRVALLLVGLDDPCKALGSPEPAAAAQLGARARERLQRCAGEGTESVRLRDDQFALLIPRMRNGAQVREAAARMLGTMRFPFQASIGIAVFPTDAVTPAALLSCAAAALATARREGRHGYSFYLPLLPAVPPGSGA